jgi:hypothetical protein
VPVAAASLAESIALRTTLNVAGADATLVLRGDGASAGTDFTVAEAVRLGKPHAVFVLGDAETAAAHVARWIEAVSGSVLNVAGPRESEASLYAPARACLRRAFALWMLSCRRGG